MSALDMSTLPRHDKNNELMEQLMSKRNNLSDHNSSIDKHIFELMHDQESTQNRRLVAVIQTHINELHNLIHNNNMRIHKINAQIEQLENPKAAWHESFFSNLFQPKKIPNTDKDYYPTSRHAMGRSGFGN